MAGVLGDVAERTGPQIQAVRVLKQTDLHGAFKTKWRAPFFRAVAMNCRHRDSSFGKMDGSSHSQVALFGRVLYRLPEIQMPELPDLFNDPWIFRET